MPAMGGEPQSVLGARQSVMPQRRRPGRAQTRMTLAGRNRDAYGRGGGLPAGHATGRAQFASAWQRSGGMTEWRAWRHASLRALLPQTELERNREMTPSQALPAVLDRIDADLDRSLERLFEFLRIQSISTDPAYQAQCRAAAEFVAGDLGGLGFDAVVRPTAGHPVVVGKGGNGSAGPHVLFYGHY